MKILLTGILVLSITATAHAKTYTVERVISGDIIKLTNGKVVRLLGIDTPESVYDALEAGIDLDVIKQIQIEAKEYLTEYINSLPRKKITLEFDVEKKDKYSSTGRWQAYVFCAVKHTNDGLKVLNNKTKHHYGVFNGKYRHFINATMVKVGYAIPMSFKPNVKYKRLLDELHHQAQDARIGLWRGNSSEVDVKSEQKKQEVQVQAIRLIVSNALDGIEKETLKEVLSPIHKEEITIEFPREEAEKSVAKVETVKQENEKIKKDYSKEDEKVPVKKEAPFEDSKEEISMESVVEEAPMEGPKEEISMETPEAIEEKESPKKLLKEKDDDIQVTKISVREVVTEKGSPTKVLAKKRNNIQATKIAVRRKEKSTAHKASREEKEYYENGVLKRHMVLFDDKNFEGFWREYYTTGGIKVDAKLLLGKGGCSDEGSIPIEGIAREYHINGQLKQSGTYVNNCEEGSHKYYSYEGLLEEELYYERGRHIWTRRYNEDGLVISETISEKLDKINFYNK